MRAFLFQKTDEEKRKPSGEIFFPSVTYPLKRAMSTHEFIHSIHCVSLEAQKKIFIGCGVLLIIVVVPVDTKLPLLVEFIVSSPQMCAQFRNGIHDIMILEKHKSSGYC